MDVTAVAVMTIITTTNVPADITQAMTTNAVVDTIMMETMSANVVTTTTNIR